MSWLTTGRIFSILILIILTSQIFTTIVSEPEEEYDPEIEKRGMEGEMRIASDPGPGVEQSRGSRTEQDIKLNEIMLFPNTGGPWVEIHNRGVEHMPIDHWLISDEDGLTYEIEMRTAVPPGNYVVVHFESGVSETEFGQSQPNAIHLYTGWKNVKWTPHEVDPFTNYIRAAVGYDILPGGKPEIIANYFGGTRISIYEPIGGDIAQGWQKTDIITAPPVDYGSYRVVPIDVDMDSFTDLVFNNYFGNENGDDSIYWLKAPITNPKDPWNGPYPIDKVRRPEGLCAGNISGDDLTDIVVGGEFDNDIYWYQCPPDPMVDIWTRYNIDTNFNKPGGLWLTDMDIDGDKDLVAVGSYGEEVAWYQRPPDPTTGTWTKHNIYKSTRSRGPAVELEGTEQTRSGSRNEFDAIGELYLKDLDVDGKMDVIVTEPKNNRVVWYQSPPDPSDQSQIWIPHVIDDNLTSPSGLEVADLDGDGREDIVATSTAGSIKWYVHPPVWELYKDNWERYVVDDSVHLTFYVNATDFDGDGDIDLVTADQNDGKIIWYENDHVSFEGIDQCSLYRSTSQIPGAINDFVAWGAPASGEDQNAVLNAIWPVNAYVPTTGLGMNTTIARDRHSTDTDGVIDWDPSNGIHSEIPTPGTMNFPYPTNSKPVMFFNPVVFTGALGSKTEPPTDMPKGVILANYSSYTVSVNVSSPFGANDIEWVEVMLDPVKARIELTWNRSDNKFSLIDNNDYVTLVPEACTAETDGIYNWRVNFTLIFNWRYPASGKQNAVVASRNTRSFQDVDDIISFYRVETGLNFTGEMKMRTTSDKKDLFTNDWILPGTGFEVNGFKVTYDIDGYEFYPADSEFDVVLEDSMGYSWIDHTSAGYDIDITAAVPESGTTGVYSLKTKLSDLSAGAAARAELTRQLYIDSGILKFDKPSPERNVWYTQNTQVCSVRISDLQPESGVLGASIAYRTATGSTDRFGPWQSLPLVGTGEVLEPAVTYDFPEGADNWIQWSASDVAGNGPVNSNPYRMHIDTENITFHEFFPPESFTQNEQNITVRLTVADFGGSGVNISTIKAALMSAGETGFSEWYDPGFEVISQAKPVTNSLPAGPETVIIETPIDGFKNGVNKIKFRALDIAGNGFSESKEFAVKLDVQVTDLSLSLVEPVNDSIVRTLRPVLKWQPFVPLDFHRLSYRIYLTENRMDHEQISSDDPESSPAFLSEVSGTALELDLNNIPDALIMSNKTYFWTVIPVYDAGMADETIGICTDGIWQFSVYLGKSGLELGADPRSVQFYAGYGESVSVRIRNIGLDSDNYSVSFTPAGGLSIKSSKPFIFLKPGEVGFINLTVSASEGHEGGEFVIELRAYSLSFPDEKSIELDIKVISQQETDKPTDEITEGTMSSYGSLILLILILLFVILLTAWNYLSFRKRKRPPSEEIRKEKKKKDGFSPAPAAARPVVEVKPPSAEIQDQDQPPSAVKTNIANQTNITNRPPTAE